MALAKNIYLSAVLSYKWLILALKLWLIFKDIPLLFKEVSCRIGLRIPQNMCSMDVYKKYKSLLSYL